MAPTSCRWADAGSPDQPIRYADLAPDLAPQIGRRDSTTYLQQRVYAWMRPPSCSLHVLLNHPLSKHPQPPPTTVSVCRGRGRKELQSSGVMATARYFQLELGIMDVELPHHSWNQPGLHPFLRHQCHRPETAPPHAPDKAPEPDVRAPCKSSILIHGPKHSQLARDILDGVH